MSVLFRVRASLPVLVATMFSAIEVRAEKVFGQRHLDQVIGQ